MRLVRLIALGAGVSSSLGVFAEDTRDSSRVLRLEELAVEGRVKQPAIIDVTATDLDKKTRDLALKHLIKLEQKILDSKR